MGREVTIYLKDALFNAGILGFYRLYSDREGELQCLEGRIKFDSDLLDQFTDRYLGQLQRQFEQETVYRQVLDLYSGIKRDENRENTLKMCLDKVKKLEGASYKSGYEIIKKRGCSYDFLSSIKEIPKIKDLDERKKALDEFIAKMKEHQDIFILKGVAYTKVNSYWESVSFFHRDAVQVEFKESVQKYFADPAIRFMPAEGKKATTSCCQCGVGLSKKDSGNMSWIIDVGIDVARKVSSFWNYNVDICTCPVCNLIYACMPLGFTILRDEGIFVNCGSSVEGLRESNAKVVYAKLGHQDEALSKNVLYGAMSKLLNEYQKLSGKKTLDNIQVVRRNAKGYTFDVISAEMLKRANRCHKELDFIVGNWMKVDIYNETISRILKGRNLYDFINELLHTMIADNKKRPFIDSLITIQALVFADEDKMKKGEGHMDSDEKKLIKITKGKIYGARMAGEALYQKMSEETQNIKKTRGLSFKLINYLKTRDVHGYVDTVLRQYMGMGMAVPAFIGNMLQDEDDFLDQGYAFVAGLQGTAPNKDVKENEGGQNDAE